MINAGEEPGSADDQADVRVGSPERSSALQALETHLIEQRLDSSEFEARGRACEVARTRSELLGLFADLPVPHPEFPPVHPDSPEPNSVDRPPYATPFMVAAVLVILLGLPLAIVLAFVYHAWWVIAAPLLVLVLMGIVAEVTERWQGSRPAE